MQFNASKVLSESVYNTKICASHSKEPRSHKCSYSCGNILFFDSEQGGAARFIQKNSLVLQIS